MNREAASTTAIPMSQKIAFGIGMLANQMFPAALSIFIVILVQSLGMSPIMWGLIFFLPELVDAITDPLMGYISDRTQSRWGKRRPYIFIGAIVAGLSYIAMWQLSEDNSLLFNFWYFLGWNIIFFLGMTIFYFSLRRHGLRNEFRLSRANAPDGGGTVDWSMGLGYCAVVLDCPVRPKLVRLSNRRRTNTVHLGGVNLHGACHCSSGTVPF